MVGIRSFAFGARPIFRGELLVLAKGLYTLFGWRSKNLTAKAPKKWGLGDKPFPVGFQVNFLGAFVVSFTEGIGWLYPCHRMSV